ncbi:MAG: sterol carrier family protein [Alphaproteobacteria bacterium]|nr:MAG: sterol carrier family protein [Alphaproteobacteria bacterium]
MSDVIDKAVAALREKLAGETLPGSALFRIGEEGCVRVNSDGVHAGEGEADVTLTADAETFRGILSGEVNPTTAYMTGRLKLEGDMGVAMKLAGLLA